MSKQQGEGCTRYCCEYRGSNIYIVASEGRVDISMENRDNFMTQAGLQLTQRLINELLDEGRDIEELAGICFEESLRAGDLPRRLSEGLVAHSRGA